MQENASSSEIGSYDHFGISSASLPSGEKPFALPGPPAPGPLVHNIQTSDICVNPESFRARKLMPVLEQAVIARKVYEYLDRLNGTEKVSHFDDCRTDAWFVRHSETRKLRVISKRCNLRWCPLCIDTKRFIITDHVTPWAKALDRPKFLTLTLKHSNAPLSLQVNNLYDFFRKFRRRRWFEKRCRGGIWFFQITYNEETGQWHPHIHVLLDAEYMQREKLSSLWLEVTGNSMVVDIRAVKNPKKAAEYVARYATAPANLVGLPFDQAVRVVDALKGRRICGTWGSGRVIKMSSQKPEDAHLWEYVAAFAIVRMWRKNNPLYELVWQAFVKDEPCIVNADMFIKPITPKPPPIEVVPETYEQLQFEFMAGGYDMELC